MAMVVGGSVATKVVAQNSDAIDNARSTAKALQQKQANDPSPTPAAAAVPAKAKPAPGAPASAIKPVATLLRVFAHRNQLQRVKVVPEADSVQIEISSSQSVTPRLSKLNSPDRVVVELPETVMAQLAEQDFRGQRRSKRRTHRHGRQDSSDDQRRDRPGEAVGLRVDSGLRRQSNFDVAFEGAAPSVAKNNPAPPRKVSNPAPVKAASPVLAAKAATAATPPTATAKSAIRVSKEADGKSSAAPTKVPSAKPEPILQAKVEPRPRMRFNPSSPGRRRKRKRRNGR